MHLKLSLTSVPHAMISPSSTLVVVSFVYNVNLQLKDIDLKADTPSSVDQSPAGTVGKGRGKGRKPRKPKAGPGQMHVNPVAMGQSPLGQGNPGMPMPVQSNNPQMGHNMGGYGQPPGMQQQGQQYGANAGQQQWYNQNQNPQQGYYPPMPGKCCKFQYG